MTDISFIIPALNEQTNMKRVLDTIPVEALSDAGLSHEVVVVDNGSTDHTAEVAADLGARVVSQPERGYGNAYFAGFEAADGDVIVTGDADCTYPFDESIALVDRLTGADLDFLSTNRLGPANKEAMKPSHRWANRLLTLISSALFRGPFHDSQSGMWVFRREVWRHLDVRSPSMAFSQEIKNEAHVKGFRCAEAPIEYRTRGGEVKLNAVRDGLGNIAQLIRHRVRARQVAAGSISALPETAPASTVGAASPGGNRSEHAA